jgi:hypothetical protein
MFTASSCRLVYAKSYKEDVDYSGAPSKPSPNTADAFVPIDKSWEFVDDIADPVLSPSGQVVDYQVAKDVVDNDYLPHLANDPLRKMTYVSTLVEDNGATEIAKACGEVDMTVHHERQNVTKIDSELLWSYARVVDNRIIFQLRGPDSVRRTVFESLNYYENGYLYHVYTKLDYYEDSQDAAAKYSYFNKRAISYENAKSGFAIDSMDYVYYNDKDSLDRVNLRLESLFLDGCDYYRMAYDHASRTVNYLCGESNDLTVYSNDLRVYEKGELGNYPLNEGDVLSSVDYSMDYLTVTPNNREFTEVYETRVTPRTSSGDIIREVIKRGRTTLLYGCKVIYPDLSKYPERDDPDDPIYW